MALIDVNLKEVVVILLTSVWQLFREIFKEMGGGFW
jgi:hypothetical protein